VSLKSGRHPLSFKANCEKLLRRRNQLLLTVASVMLHSGAVWAADGPHKRSVRYRTTRDSQSSANATNVTHWGLGAGVGLEESPYKGYGSKVSPIPLIYFDDKWIHAPATTLDLEKGKVEQRAVITRGQLRELVRVQGSDAPILKWHAKLTARSGSARHLPGTLAMARCRATS